MSYKIYPYYELASAPSTQKPQNNECSPIIKTSL